MSKVFHLNKVIHAAASVCIPFFSIAALYSYISDFFPFSNRLSPPELSIVFFIGLTCRFIFHITRKERASPFSYVRLFIFMYLFFWIVLLFINEGSIRERATPSILQIFLMLMLALQYVWSMHLANLFYEYDKFLDFAQSYSGDELFSKLREQGEISSSSGGSLRAGIILSFIVPVIMVSVTLLTGGDRFTVSISTRIFAAVSCVCSALTLAYVSLTRDERYYAGQGLDSVFSKSSLRFRFSLIILFSSALASVFFAGPDALFVQNGEKPFYLVFLSWLLALLKSRSLKSFNGEFPAIEAPENQGEGMPDFFTPPEGMEGSIDLSWLYDILKFAGLAVLLVFFIVAVFGPFFSRDWKNFWKEKKFLKYLSQIAAAFKGFFKSLFSKDNEQKDHIVLSESARKLARSLDEFAHLKKSKEKKDEIGRLSKKYVELCLWGEKEGSACTKATAPYEYSVQLYSLIGWYENELKTIGMLFEKALFSSSLLTQEEEHEFRRLIDIITNLTLEKKQQL